MRTAPLLATIAFVIILSPTSRAHANAVSDPSFELLPPGTSIGGTTVFTSTGTWTIDAGGIVPAESSIIPLDGDQMLRFTQTSHSSADIFQLLDAADLPDALELSMYVNANEVRTFSMGFAAYDASQLPINVNAADASGRGCDFESDDDPATWERVAYRFSVPDTARFVAVGISGGITGTPSYADLVTLEPYCPDVTGNGQVGFADVLELLADWGACPPCTCPADVTANGNVGFDDLLVVLAAWGSCG